MDKFKELFKKFFSSKNILDDIIIGKGIREIVKRIPEAPIAWIAKLGNIERELAITGITMLVNELIPEDKRDEAATPLETFSAEINHRVEEYKKEHGDEESKKAEEKAESKTEPTTPAAPTPSEIMTKRRALINNPHVDFILLRKIRNDNLNTIYNRPDVAGDKYAGIDKDEFRKKVDAALAILPVNSFLGMLGNKPGDDEARVDYINGQVGEMKAKKAEKSFSEKLDAEIFDPTNPGNINPTTELGKACLGIENALSRFESALGIRRTP